MSDNNLICGIDLGDHGAIAWLGQHEPILEDMPVVRISKSRVELDTKQLWETLLRKEPVVVYVEKLQPMPKGGQANFKRGGYLYALRAICTALSVSLIEIRPQEWQKTFGIKNTKEVDTKGQSYQIASRLFPEMDLKGAKGAIKDGRCDALLIAEYGRRAEGRK